MNRIHRLSGLGMIVFLLFGLHNQAFGQSPCIAGNPVTIVVLGSSTAAGTGPSPVDSAWVWRYRRYVQSVNPASQVINLAQGGYSTYHMMPTGYTPPPGRPSPDTLKNITRALTFNPDAIIINFPSNDVSQGFSVAEQLRNDSTVWAIAQNAGVPVWISTTQPKNFGVGSVNTQKQIQVKDSLLARYGSHVLDFWTVIADSNGQIVPAYNSGDGTHLNNAGHWILFNRVKDAHVLDSIYSPPPFPDHFGLGLSWGAVSACGNALTPVNFLVANKGTDNLNALAIQVRVTETISGNQQLLSANLANGQLSCTSDTVSLTVNTSAGGNFVIEAWADSPQDGDRSNDTLRMVRTFLGEPVMAVQGDTGCSSTSLWLEASTGGNDYFYWYDSDTSTTVLSTQPQYATPILSASDTFWVEAIRGELFNRNSIFTTNSYTVNWNGAMLDIVALQDLVVDSFQLKISSLGTQLVRAYAKTGTHIGFQGNASAWTYLGERTVNVVNADSMVTIAWDSLPILTGDTMGLYFHLTNSGSTLRYQSVGSPQARSNPEIEIRTGSGVSFTFGSSFYPRDLNCRVFYHYGSRPGGDCSTGRIPVPAMISTPSVHIGPDTILNVNDSYTLSANGQFASYQWSNGATTPTVLLDGNTLGTGIYVITLLATDSLGCEARDTAIVVFAPLVGTDLTIAAEMQIWPNPVSGILHWKAPIDWQGTHYSVSLADLTGKTLIQQNEQGREGEMDLSAMPKGLYFCWLEKDGRRVKAYKVVVQ